MRLAEILHLQSHSIGSSKETENVHFLGKNFTQRFIWHSVIAFMRSIRFASVVKRRLVSTLYFQILLGLNLAPVLSNAQNTVSAPFAVPWNTTITFGTDGPWHAASIWVGTGNDGDGNQVNLYPGGFFQSIINSAAMCAETNNGPGYCLSGEAGLYDPSDSETAVQNFTAQAGSLGQWGSDSALNLTGQAFDVYDTVSIFSNAQDRVRLNNISLSVVDASNFTLPSGTSYPTELGSLSLGAPQLWQNYTEAQGWTIPGWLRKTGATPSNSFGLHYGSASLSLTASLVFGGYDQSRVLGPVGTFDIGFNDSMSPTLLSISFGVASGPSPFPNTTLLSTNLLPQDQQSPTTPGISTVLNPLIPYLLLPPTTCTAIAAALPLVYSPSLALYLWNTTSPTYNSILTTQTSLNFTFQSPGPSSTPPLSILLPLALLNLTLRPPFTKYPTPYFPCRPFVPFEFSEAGANAYFLGRAFFQAAFVGMNWEQGKFFLGQAPGPNAGASQIVPLDPEATTVAAASGIEAWMGSWGWKEETSQTNASAPTPVPVPGKSSFPAGGGGGLSRGAKAGAAVGSVLGAAILLSFIYVTVVFWRGRRRGGREPGKDGRDVFETDEGRKRVVVEAGWVDPRELGGGGGEAHEVDEGVIYEVGSRERYEADGGQVGGGGGNVLSVRK